MGLACVISTRSYSPYDGQSARGAAQGRPTATEMTERGPPAQTASSVLAGTSSQTHLLSPHYTPGEVCFATPASFLQMYIQLINTFLKRKLKIKYLTLTYICLNYSYIKCFLSLTFMSL